MKLENDKFSLEYIEDENGTIYVNYQDLRELLTYIAEEMDEDEAKGGLVAVADFLEEMRKQLMEEQGPSSSSHH